MQIVLKDKWLTLDPSLNPAYTFDCGQVFRWQTLDSSRQRWIGTVGNHVLEVSRRGVRVVSSISEEHYSSNDLETLVSNYFSSQDDLAEINSSFPHDPFLDTAIKQFVGLKILTQDPWECLISFVCSINKNIPSIKGIVRKLSRRFGKPIIPGSDGNFHTFPEPSELAKATKSQLMGCGVGFRWKYIKFIADKVASCELDLSSLHQASFVDSRRLLISKISRRTFGVGPKVADCTLLFSLHRTEAFPIDVWMFRCLKDNYGSLIHQPPHRIKFAPSNYEKMSALMRERFGKYAGYAQQYMYLKMRDGTKTYSK